MKSLFRIQSILTCILLLRSAPAFSQDAATVPLLPPPPAAIPAYIPGDTAEAGADGSSNAAAEAGADYADDLPAASPAALPPAISEIRIDGLKKTRESYLQTILKKYRAIPADALDLHEVETALQAEGIFETATAEVLIEATADSAPDSSPRQAAAKTAVLHITVQEKISFIPLPFAASSNGSALGGLFILDTNAFGVKDMYMIGGVFSATSLVAMTNFSKPSLSRTRPGFSVGGSVSKNNAEFTDMEEDDLLSYDAVGFNVHAAVSDRLSEHSQLSLGVSYSQSDLHNVESHNGYSIEADSYKAVAATASWGMATQDWNGWFMSGKSLSLSGNVRFYTDGTVSPSAAARLVLEQSVLSPRLRLVSQVNGACWYNDHFSQLGSGSSVGVAILPDDFRSAKLAGGTAGFEYAFAKARWALFSVYANYQAVYNEDSDETMRFTHGASGGLRMYLTKIAFPALAFGLAYNVPLSMVKWSAAFGVSM